MRLPLTTKPADSKAVADLENQAQAGKARRANALLKAGVALAVAGALGGCDTKDFFNPTAVVRSGHPTEPLVVPILSTLDYQAENGPSDYANAVPPTHADMVTSANDYTIGRNDLLNISVSDLMGPGQETVKTARVSESGNISLPYIGAVHAEGLSEIELERAIVQAYRDANIIQNAQVSVTVVEARGRTVEILGAVNAAGQYAILDSDFRLLDALVLARDVTTPLTEYIYVIRKSEARHAGPARPPGAVQPGGASSPKPPTSGPSSEDLAPRSDAGQGNGTTPGDSAQATVKPLSLLADAPATMDLAPATQPSTAAATAPATATPAAPATAAPAAPATPPFTPSAPFEFNAPENTGNARIIRIPYPALRAGDLNYNIAIHPRDIIVVQQLPVGEYYMGGHIARPGAFTLSGRRITLKEAVISAGMFDELAIPQRTDIIRRIKPDREVFVRVDLERIFAGELPDLYLKPDDQVLVGTNALAPFIAAIRGAFRITYGFGFLYDRNFAYSNNSQGF